MTDTNLPGSDSEGYQIYIRVPGGRELSSDEVTEVLQSFASLIADKDRPIEVELDTEYDEDGWVDPPTPYGADEPDAADDDGAGDDQGLTGDTQQVQGAEGTGVPAPVYARRRRRGRSLIPAYICHNKF